MRTAIPVRPSRGVTPGQFCRTSSSTRVRLLLHTQRDVGCHHRRLVRLSVRPFADRHGRCSGPSNSNVIGTATLDSTQRAGDGGAGGLDGWPRHALPVAHRHARHRGIRTQSGTSTAASNLATTASSNLASISGVNQNQQEVDILSAQNAFQAASQAINAINQSFQSLLQAV